MRDARQPQPELQAASSTAIYRLGCIPWLRGFLWTTRIMDVLHRLTEALPEYRPVA